MNKYLVTLILAALSFCSYGQDSTSLYFKINSEAIDNSVDSIGNPRVVIKSDQGVFIDTVTDDSGELYLKFSSDKFKEGTPLGVEIIHGDFYSNGAQIIWKASYEFYNEVILKGTCPN